MVFQKMCEQWAVSDFSAVLNLVGKGKTFVFRNFLKAKRLILFLVIKNLCLVTGAAYDRVVLC